MSKVNYIDLGDTMYNSLHGTNEDAGLFLKWLGLSVEDFGRFRDAHLNKSGTRISILARIGAGSWSTEDVRQRAMKCCFNNPHYLEWHDDTFDPTYRYITFAVPNQHADEAKRKAPNEEAKDIETLTKELKAEMASMTKEQMEADPRFKPIIAALRQIEKK